MATVIKSPHSVVWDDDKPTVFLAGTIDNGISFDWQQQVTSSLMDCDVTLLNPRRDEWDASWEQTIHNPKFREQVEWELNCLEKASAIFIYFSAGSRSPISLLEFGLHAASNKMLVVCPIDFWRRGNIEVVANRYQIPLFDTLDNGILSLKSTISNV